MISEHCICEKQLYLCEILFLRVIMLLWTKLWINCEYFRQYAFKNYLSVVSKHSESCFTPNESKHESCTITGSFNVSNFWPYWEGDHSIQRPSSGGYTVLLCIALYQTPKKTRRSLLLSFDVNKPYPQIFVFIEQRALGPIGEYIFVSFWKFIWKKKLWDCYYWNYEMNFVIFGN